MGAQMIGLLFIIGWIFVIMFPFFVWLDWKGWFRSDPLEEIVGLDTSYHGGLALLSGGDEVNPEYISAFKRKKEENNMRRRSRIRSPNVADTITGESTDGREIEENDADDDDAEHEYNHAF